MPKRTDIQSILIIGAGPIVIGQACEFDYSGTQACKALQQEGYRVVLLNSNPATIMTDPDMADVTYIEPITPAIVTKILEKERPDALLPTMGGQTALNIAMALSNDGILENFNVQMIGAHSEVIAKAENRELFHDAMHRIGLDSPRSCIVQSVEEARAAVADIGIPVIIRPSFTLAGTGGGIIYNVAMFEQVVANGLTVSPVHEVLVEESVLGWKEYEMEVIRDSHNNCIVVCSIENVDPMGVHTGDSITVAPALTLTDKEYQIMRNAAIACLREIGVNTGGSNVQFAVNPQTGRMVIIEMNPRVSRSSALASKATGFPIAKVAAKLAVGYTLDELTNDITGIIPASFEPTIDYVVTKVPRFAFEKFPDTEPLLTTSMKSVGEVMAIGRSFQESLQKALRSLETGLTGLNEVEVTISSGDIIPSVTSQKDVMLCALSQARPDRILVIAQAFRQGLNVEEINANCHYDPWFLEQIKDIVLAEFEVKIHGLPTDVRSFQRLKAMGFSDQRLAELTSKTYEEVVLHREKLDIHPVYKRVDTCGAEFPSRTPYMYSCYEGDKFSPVECEANPSDREKVVILGGGPNRIGQGIEFDYCCCHAAFALREIGYEAIVVNCNPETVSTDYDTADRLYFEPLTIEDVLALLKREQSNGRLLGVIVQLGGQTPLKLSQAIAEAGIDILGTSPDAIDLAEDRERFQIFLKKLGLRQPANGIARSLAEAHSVAERIGYPVVLRPSYVLGGRAMQIVYGEEVLSTYMASAVRESGNDPVLIDRYLDNAIEIDVDVISDNQDVYIAGIMQHIEEAGIHSGDSACTLPPYTLSAAVIDRIKYQTRLLARELHVIGLMNVQFAIKDNVLYVLEVNPRASRTVPFVAKATGLAIAKIAARVMVGESLTSFHLSEKKLTYVAVKEAVFPFSRFPNVDIILGPEMKSTGESMGIDINFRRAFAKSQLGAGIHLPTYGTVFLSVKNSDKLASAELAYRLVKLGFKLSGTRGTACYLQSLGLDITILNKVLEGHPHCVDAMLFGEIQLVINTTEGDQSLADSFSIRRTALVRNLPYYTTMTGAQAAIEAIEAIKCEVLDVTPLQLYFKLSPDQEGIGK